MSKDKGMQKVYLQLCQLDPRISFNTMFWTFNPMEQAGCRNLPFILRPAQDRAVVTIKRAIDEQFDVVVNKSREEGATEIIRGILTNYWLFIPQSTFLCGSRTEDDVDKVGNPKSLFWKFDYGLEHLPVWLKKNLRFERFHLHLLNLLNDSTIDGEATSESFGAGARALAVWLGEFGRIWPADLAASVRQTVSDVARCVIYDSTHWYGEGHPFAKIIKEGKAKIVLLPWYENPVKNKGLYKSPDVDIIEIIDIDYYRRVCPYFNNIEPHKAYRYSEIEPYIPKEIKFVADGCENIPGDVRSPWHDYEELRRDRRDMASNVWMCPSGASDAYFDPIVVDRWSMHCRQPKYAGEIEFSTNKENKINYGEYKIGHGRKRLKWWGDLIDGRPNQSHNFIVGCDISAGTGASNSIAYIADTNTSELVGCFADPNMSSETFADYVVGTCKWLGGANKNPFLIWENSGGHGINFGKRIIANGYSHVYSDVDIRSKKMKRRNIYGWASSEKAKDDLLAALRAALAEGLNTQVRHKALKIYDEELVNELRDYMYYGDGTTVGPSKCQDLSTGARQRHGDRVIAAGLVVRAMLSQPKGDVVIDKVPPRDSMEYRFQEHKQELIKEKLNKRFSFVRN